MDLLSIERHYNHWIKKVQVIDKSQDMQVTLDQQFRKSLKPNQNDGKKSLHNIVSRNFLFLPKNSGSPLQIDGILIETTMADFGNF